MIYLDNAATTPIADHVVEVMTSALRDEFGNPSSPHSVGQSARRAVEGARRKVAGAIAARPSQIVLTPSGTVANNLAIRGLARRYSPGNAHIITSGMEHASVRNTCASLQKDGYELTVLPVDPTGRIEMDALKAAIRADTVLVSVMYGNNEVGTIQPVEAVAAVCRERGVLFHCDAVQALGHIGIDLTQLSVDMMTFSAHKIHGPKGVGALFVRNRDDLAPIVTGGGHEHGLWAGTENVPGIIGFGAAAEALPTLLERSQHVAHLRDMLIDTVSDSIEGAVVTGHREHRLPHIASFCIQGVSGDALVMSLDGHGIKASTGSACATGSTEPSHVLEAMGIDDDLAAGSLRLSLNCHTTESEIERTCDTLRRVVARLRNGRTGHKTPNRPTNPLLADPVHAGRLKRTDRQRLVQQISALRHDKNAVILAHNYQLPEVQDIADFCGDSLQLSRKAAQTDADIIVFCGVNFMAETAALLCPDKTVLLPVRDARCPMADMVTPQQVRALRSEHPEAPAVAYVNTTAAVKAEVDICCTSSNAVQIVRSLAADKVIFVPDRNLAQWVRRNVEETEVIYPDGFCPTHHNLAPSTVEAVTRKHPDVAVLAHPECRPEVTQMADLVTSTGGMVRYARTSADRGLLILTECGLVHRLRRENGDRTFYPANQMVCPNMKKTGLRDVRDALHHHRNVIEIDPDTASRAATAVEKMFQLA